MEITQPSIAKQLTKLAVETYEILLKERDLSPRNKLINQSLSTLVSQISKYHYDLSFEQIMNEPALCDILPGFYQKLAQAETEMENYEAKRLLARQNLNFLHLQQFRYWRNYDQLVEAEVEMMQPYLGKQPIVFVGSGPLPLSVIILQMMTHCTVIGIDGNHRAVDQSQKVITNLQQTRCHIHCTWGEQFDYQPFCLVILASLVPNKKAVIKRICETNPNALIAIRTVERGYCLLYQPFAMEVAKQYRLTLLHKTQANEQMINTTYLFAQDGRGVK